MKEKTKELIQTYALIILGTFIMSIGFVVFISPLKLAPGGVYGIAIILHHVFNFPIGLSGICLDLPLLLIGTLWLGPKFGAKTLVGVITLPAFISLWEKVYGYAPLIGLPGDPMTPDPAAAFIVALCGGELRDALQSVVGEIGGGNLLLFFLEVLVLGFLGSCATCLRCYSALAIGHSAADHKMLLSFVAYIVIGFALSVVRNSVLLGLLPSIDPGAILAGMSSARWFLKNKLNLA